MTSDFRASFTEVDRAGVLELNHAAASARQHKLWLCGLRSCYHRSGCDRAYSCFALIRNASTPQVDTHVHHSACMHQKHLLRFIKSKLKKEPDEVVIFRDGKWLTLREVFESLTLTGCAPGRDTLTAEFQSSWTSCLTCL